MNDGAMDKRSRRTRQAIETALLSLIETRGYGPVSVRDICDEAEVSRSTFYAHYADKDDLKRSGLRHLRLELDSHPAGTAHYDTSSLERALFEHAAKYRSHYRALVRGEVAVQFLAGGYFALLTGWLDSDETTTAPNVGAVLQRIYGAHSGEQPAPS